MASGYSIRYNWGLNIWERHLDSTSDHVNDMWILRVDLDLPDIRLLLSGPTALDPCIAHSALNIPPSSGRYIHSQLII